MVDLEVKQYINVQYYYYDVTSYTNLFSKHSTPQWWGQRYKSSQNALN